MNAKIKFNLRNLNLCDLGETKNNRSRNKMHQNCIIFILYEINIMQYNATLKNDCIC